MDCDSASIDDEETKTRRPAEILQINGVAQRKEIFYVDTEMRSGMYPHAACFIIFIRCLRSITNSRLIHSRQLDESIRHKCNPALDHRV